MPAPTIHMDLYSIPVNVHHAAPQIGFAVAIAIVGEHFHRLQVIIMIPGTIRVIDVILVKQIFVVIQGEGAVILRKPKLPAIAREKGTILSRIPICDRRLVKVCLHIRAQVERVTFLSPGWKMGAAALEEIGGRPSLHIDRHLIDDVGRIRDEIDVDIGVSSVKLFEKLPGHRLEPVVAEILIDQLDSLRLVRWILAGVSCKPRAPHPRWSNLLFLKNLAEKEIGGCSFEATFGIFHKNCPVINLSIKVYRSSGATSNDAYLFFCPHP